MFFERQEVVGCVFVGLSEVGEKSAFRCSSVCRSGLSARFRVCAACMRASVVRFHFSFWGSVCCFGGKGGSRKGWKLEVEVPLERARSL